jgi:hypothetical protein
MAPFSAIENDGDGAYADLAAGLSDGVEARLFRPANEPLPAGWVGLDAFPMHQMVLRQLPPTVATGPRPTDLTTQDAPALMKLAQIAKPGPFGQRTAELGAFIGVVDGSRLVAMAGERMRLAGYVELSGRRRGKFAVEFAALSLGGASAFDPL